MGKLPANVGTVSCRTRAGGRRLPAPGRTTLRIVHDENYKRLFAFPRLVEDLLRVVGESEWLEETDFTSLRKLSSEYVSDDLRRRHGDTVWQVRLGRDWLHVLVLLEFQSRDDPDMALRILEYTTLLYRELRRNEALGRDGLRPPVLPIVLYNGAARWKAAREVRELIAPAGPYLSPYQPSQRYLVLDERHVDEDDLPRRNLMTAVVGLEQSRTPADLVRVVDALRERLRTPRDGELRRTFGNWVRRMAEVFMQDKVGDLSPADELDEVRKTLVEHMGQWPAEWVRKGLEQGLEHERTLLCRMAASRFGADTSERLSPALARISNPDRLADVGDWLVRCDTAEEFLARALPSPDEGEPAEV